MKKYTIGSTDSSRVTFESLETYARDQVQRFLQWMLEDEVRDLFGRDRYERRHGVDATEGYRNGYGKPRRLSMSSGTITVRRPRVRGLEERFESRILPVFKRRTKELGDMLPDLYLHGLSEGDFDLALRGLLGEGAPLSASSIARLKQKWQGEFDEWKNLPLGDKQVVYLWVDGVYVKAGLEKRKAAMLVVVAGLRDGTKEVIAIEAGHRESTESWSAVLRDLKKRGMNSPKLVIGDGHLGIWSALANVFPDTQEQRCWNHRILNVLDKIHKKEHRQAKLTLTAIPYAETERQAVALKKKFQEWCRSKDFDAAADRIDHDWQRMVTFYRFPTEHWKHLRTTNIVESPFATVRLRTGAAKRFKKVENATAVIWKVLMVAQKRFRKLNAPQLLASVAEGATFADGIRIKNKEVNKERKEIA